MKNIRFATLCVALGNGFKSWQRPHENPLWAKYWWRDGFNLVQPDESKVDPIFGGSANGRHVSGSMGNPVLRKNGC